MKRYLGFVTTPDLLDDMVLHLSNTYTLLSAPEVCTTNAELPQGNRFYRVEVAE